MQGETPGEGGGETRANAGAQIDRAWLRALPKAELHCHLEGAIPPALALALAERAGVRLPGVASLAAASSKPERIAALESAFAFSDFSDFIQLYVAISRCLHDAEAFERAVLGVAEALKRAGVVYAELTFTPMTHVARGVDPEAMLAGLARGRARAAEQEGVEIAWVFDIVRAFPDQGAATVDLALRAGAVALGVGGPEGPGYPGEPLAPHFARAKAEGLRSVPHAGEQDGPRSIREALELFAADRIGHGFRAVEDRGLVDELRARGCCLELCPTSNLALGLVSSLHAHPMPALLEAGVPCVLASDDPALFRCDLLEAYARCASAFAWTRAEVLAQIEQSFRSSFLAPARREAWIARTRAAAGA